MIIGFTGTREGMTSNQKAFVRAFLEFAKDKIDEVVHGMCIGADAEFDKCAKSFKIPRRGLPGVGRTKGVRANCDCETIERERPFLVRNAIIVDIADTILACPSTERPQSKGGTWWTIRYARRQGKRLCIVYPSGRHEIIDRVEGV